MPMELLSNNLLAVIRTLDIILCMFLCQQLQQKIIPDLFSYIFKLYAYTFLTPIGLTILMKCLGSEIKLFQTICLYGYSIAVLIVITILCMLPFSVNDHFYFSNYFQWIQWILVLYGFVTSCIFLLRNLQKELESLESNRKIMVCVLIVIIQLILCLAFKIEFFTIITKNESVMS